MPQWPHDSQEKLEAAGYVLQDTSKCLAPACNTTVHWFLTPKGRYMPMERSEEGVYQPHFATCVDARKFSRRGKPDNKGSEVVER